ncbi:UDP-N-acetylmuramoyl-L-alanine--D-glutamate ligase [Candidatus Fermentibacteria bacterium]|nr:UDP-N-acetylmuramoyl-L-alanine--D-glutamate ligase [Candidatus Fermentibacteria bacterium]
MAFDRMCAGHTRGIRPGDRVLVVGMGRSGQAAASLLLGEGAYPLLADDDGGKLRHPVVEALIAAGAAVAEADAVAAVSLVVSSPGVPPAHPLLTAARERGIPVWGELELASRSCRAPLLAVTGSDGKSTTCAMMAHLIATAGREVVLGGNIGTPLSSLVSSLPCNGLAVVEVSSYQLETTESFRPWVAGLLNVEPDHLERHGSLDAYARAKARIFGRQGPGDWAVINGDRAGLGALVPAAGATVLEFSTRRSIPAGACLMEGWLTHVWRGERQRILRAGDLPVPGHHNVENALAALTMVLPLELRPEHLAVGLSSFRALPHRLEPVGTVAGVDFVNDSKATNVHSAAAGLASMERPVVLLVGGKDKGLSFAPLAEAARNRARMAFAYGEAGVRLAEALALAVPAERVVDLVAAVHAAARSARPGDVVLLSPACSSFDAYGSFEQRGEHFRELVMALPGYAPVGHQESPKKSSR